MKTNELKKGDKVELRNGWKATIEDNKKGNTRMATVYGACTEMGSVYAHDIIRLIDGDSNEKFIIEHTPEQLALQERIKKMGW